MFDIKLTLDLVVKNAKIVTPIGIYTGGVGVDDGKIVVIGADSTLPAADETIDAKGFLVMPGAIDPHVHMGIYNPLEDDIRDTTMIQAVGGVTTSFEMKPDKRSYKESIPELKRAIDRNAHIDVTIYMTVMTQQHIDELPYAFGEGVTRLSISGISLNMNSWAFTTLIADRSILHMKK